MENNSATYTSGQFPFCTEMCTIKQDVQVCMQMLKHDINQMFSTILTQSYRSLFL